VATGRTVISGPRPRSNGSSNDTLGPLLARSIYAKRSINLDRLARFCGMCTHPARSESTAGLFVPGPWSSPPASPADGRREVLGYALGDSESDRSGPTSSDPCATAAWPRASASRFLANTRARRRGQGPARGPGRPSARAGARRSVASTYVVFGMPTICASSLASEHACVAR
jgi:hypothetical protein